MNLVYFKILCVALIRYIAEYGSIIWFPNQKNVINKIEILQIRFYHVLEFKIKKAGVDLNNIASDLSVNSLTGRQHPFDVL